MKTILSGKIDISALLKAHQFLKKGLLEAKSELEIAGVIQAFEFCYELAWKTMKRILLIRGVDVFSPKQTFRAAAMEGLISQAEVWFDFVELRNLTVHTYSEETAHKIYHQLPCFEEELTNFIEKIRGL